MNRRDFLKALGIGLGAAAAPALVEPVRKLWFVPSSAPVGSRVERLDEYTIQYGFRWHPTAADALAMERAKRQQFADWALRQQQKAYADAALVNGTWRIESVRPTSRDEIDWEHWRAGGERLLVKLAGKG